jgi:hypothetical protein
MYTIRFWFICIFIVLLSVAIKLYATNILISKPGKFYYIDPISGNDSNTGLDQKNPWKSFSNANKRVFKSGDILKVISPGIFHESLIIKATGTRKNPVKVIFTPGTYQIYPDHALKLPLHISNTNVKPYEPKAIALMIDSSQNVIIYGERAVFKFHGKMIQTYINHSSNIIIRGFTFDYTRPTVSELKVIEVGTNHADLLIHKDSYFMIKDSTLVWQGEGWSHQATYLWQKLNQQNNLISRLSFNMQDLRFAVLANNNVRVVFKKNPGFIKSNIYQNRETERDCAGIFMQESKNLLLDRLNINFMHGMGIIGQLCNNITLNKVKVKPAKSSGRTCAAWADILHFSGCRGIIEIKNNYLSSANDDAINVHGTYLKVTEIISPNKIKLKYMHHETYGFNPYTAGDSIEFIRKSTLLPGSKNIVQSSRMINDKEVEVTLRNVVDHPLSADYYVENISATPSVNIHHNTISRIPTRGILVTTRRPIRIWKNTFLKTHMSGILVSDDASSWYESGRVLDLQIENNNFIFCGEPVINIAPENNHISAESVHQNILISNNYFILKNRDLLSAKSTSTIALLGNKIRSIKPVRSINDLVRYEVCKNIQMKHNKIR